MNNKGHNHLPSNNSDSIRGGNAFCKSSVADGRSEGPGDINCRSKDSCSGNSATHEGGNSAFCFRSDKTTCLSIAVPNGCQSSKKTTPKLYMSACTSIKPKNYIILLEANIVIWLEKDNAECLTPFHQS